MQLSALLKEYAAPSTATSGLAGYSLEGQRRAKRRRLAAALRMRLCVVKGDVTTDRAAHAAATSPLNLKPQPTEDQKTAGNYPKGHLRIGGLDVSIENPAGSHRRPEWPTLKSHYGYIRLTMGADGDHVDCFVRVGTPDDYAGPVHVVNQNVGGKFDEYKVMLGWERTDDARAAYLENYERGWTGLGSMVSLPMADFKAWLAEGDTTKPLRRGLFALLLTKIEWNEEDHPRDDYGRFGEGSGGISNKDSVWMRDGKSLSAEDQSRMKALGVPPAWTNVELNPDAKGDLQVVGKDSKGRDQYLYSAEHSERAAAEKFARLQEFNKVAPAVRDIALKDMQNTDLNQGQRDTAAATALIAETGFRIGGTADTGADKQAYGATTLLGSHVVVDGNNLRFEFTGKKGVEITKELDHPALAAYISERQAANGDGALFKTTDAAVRDYFHSKAGDDFKVKDFRTWHATALALREVAKPPPPKTERQFKSQRLAVGKTVARFLGNTASVALASYINPAVFSSWHPQGHGT
jgi:DNA topoisomerase IB